MIEIRHLVLAIVVATSVTACGGAEPDSPTHPACNASAPTGAVLAAEQRPEVPFTIQVPQLPAWQQTPVEGGDSVLRVGLGKGSATVTIRVLPARDSHTTSIISVSMGDGWRESGSETIAVCGLEATRTTGILPASDGDHYKELLTFSNDVGEMNYLIMMWAQVPAAERDTYRPDFDTIVNGLQIVQRGTP
ncbi:hypothetical protein [Nocardia ninae]|uniref:Lipoprotein LpqN n=1 Tax=Nocardia ninae NBRC 108245 TaxID=1210091 RepID=A0A511M6M4_9NOCA|nr:hypothetical protein [Nocardia ninae]GEM35788.1 hypothetical protein NN4_03070 [Nocardia ninae NBRC 108245]